MAWGFTPDQFSTVKEIIEACDASKCITGKQCEQSLITELEKALVNQTVVKGEQSSDV